MLREIRQLGVLAQVGPLTLFGWIVVLTLLAIFGAAVKFIVQ